MLRIGILGANSIAETHIKALLKLDQLYEIKGFYEPNEKLAKELILKYKLNVFKDFETLLRNVDVVDIVSPTIKHYEYASIMLRRSKHIFIEKPMTTTLDDAKSLISLSKEADVKVQIGSQERFNDAFEDVLHVLNKPLLIETKRTLDHKKFLPNQCLVLDYMINDIDLILSVNKSGVKKITANGLKVYDNGLDLVDVRIDFDNGSIAKLTIDKLGEDDSVVTTFYQSNSIVKVDFVNNTNSIQNLKGEENKKFNHSNSKMNELKSFHESITKDSETKVSLLNGLDTLIVVNKIIDHINRSNFVYNDNNI
jgi:predicted dehydrogenase